MAESEKVKLIVTVPRELKERLDAMAEDEDRPLSSVVRRLLLKAVTVDEAGARALAKLEALPSDPPTRSAGPAVQVQGRREVPIGGQDAASGAGVEARADAPYRTLAEIREDGEPEVAKSACRHPEARRVGSRCGVCDAKVGPVGTVGR